MTATKCPCPSCSAGLCHYDAERPVSVAGRTKTRLLWGEVLELAVALGDAVGERIHAALNKAAEFVYAGVAFRPGRCEAASS